MHKTVFRAHSPSFSLGAAGGIGTAICSKFAGEGATVVLVDIVEDALQGALQALNKRHENNHIQFAGDIADSKFAEELFKKVEVSLSLRIVVAKHKRWRDGLTLRMIRYLKQLLNYMQR